MTLIDIEPREDQERIRGGRKKVTLYAVGWEYYQVHKYDPPPVTTKMMPIFMPELGESITLDEVYAKDLLFKTRYKGKAVLVLESEGGKEMAALLKSAIKNGEDLSELNLKRLTVKKEVTALTDDDLLEEIRRRNLTTVPAEVRDEVIASSEVKKVEKPPSKTQE
jgi:hypothetical protein